MRIGIDVRSLLDKHTTGVGEYTREIVNNLLLSAPDVEFRLFASGTKPRTLEDIGLKSIGNASLKWLKRPSKVVSISTSLGQRPYIDAFLGGVDAFFSPNLNFTALTPDCPHVITIHDVSFKLFPEFFSAKRRIWHAATHAESMIRSADHVICDSRSTSADVQKWFDVSIDNVSVIPLGYDINKRPRLTDKKLADIRQRYKLPDDYVISLGTIEPRKNLVGLVRAYEKFRTESPRKCKLLVVGPIGWKSKAFRQAVRQSKHSSDINVMGYVPFEDRVALMSQANCLLNVSSYEGFGLPVLEAMRLGIPVITSNVSSLPEVIGEHGILVNPERPLEIAQALQNILADQSLAVALVKKAHTRAKLFTWDKAAYDTLHVLTSVAENRTWRSPVMRSELMEAL